MNYVEVKIWDTIRVVGASAQLAEAKKIAARHSKEASMRWSKDQNGWLQSRVENRLYTISGSYYTPCTEE